MPDGRRITPQQINRLIGGMKWPTAAKGYVAALMLNLPLPNKAIARQVNPAGLLLWTSELSPSAAVAAAAAVA